jgi:hypothetical protein
VVAGKSSSWSVSPFRSNNCGFSSSTSSTSMVSETRALVRVGIIRRVLTGSNSRDGCRSDHGMDVPLRLRSLQAGTREAKTREVLLPERETPRDASLQA